MRLTLQPGDQSFIRPGWSRSYEKLRAWVFEHNYSFLLRKLPHKTPLRQLGFER